MDGCEEHQTLLISFWLAAACVCLFAFMCIRKVAVFVRDLTNVTSDYLVCKYDIYFKCSYLLEEGANALSSCELLTNHYSSLMQHLAELHVCVDMFYIEHQLAN